MGRIWVTSDLHFCHDRGFIYEPRGFSSVGEMNYAIVSKWNDVVQYDDDVYLLGDVMLNDNVEGLRLLNCLKGRIHIVVGNHDTLARIELFKKQPNVVEVAAALYLHYRGYHFYCTHYPCLTGNLEKEALQKTTCNLYGHTHQITNFYRDTPFMYHVGVDSHDCAPVLLDDVIDEMENKVKECIVQL